jgi:hypothetical protein
LKEKKQAQELNGKEKRKALEKLEEIARIHDEIMISLKGIRKGDNSG